jgi:phage baseplate assembly protein gpV
MISRTWSRKSIAFCLAIAVLSVYSMVVLASPGYNGQTGPSGELSVTGLVTINGQNAISGATVLPDSTITTAANSTATVTLGSTGRVELSPGSSLKLSFTDAGIMGSLSAGRVRVSNPAKISAVITTNDGSAVADTSQADVFTVDVECGNTVVATETGKVELRAGNTTKQVSAGQDATAGTAQPGTRCTRLKTEGMHGLSGGALAALLIAAGGAIAAALFATSHKNDLNFCQVPPCDVIISPTK